MTGQRRTSRKGSIDGGEGRGIRLGPGQPEYLGDDETFVDDPIPVNDFSELENEEDGAPSDRRRDPLRNRL